MSTQKELDMKKTKLLFGIFTALVFAFFSGCTNIDEQQSELDGNGMGRLVIKLTDAPFPYEMIESATVSIVKVEIRKKCDCEEEGYPYIELPLPDGKDTVVFNLLELMNGVTADLIDMEIEPGEYDLIRLYVAKAGLEVVGGDKYEVKVPSGPQTGIKVFMKPPLKVVSSLTTDVTLDFNLEKSFVLKGNANTPAGIKGFNFKPVVKVINNTTAGTLAGEVTDAETEELLPGATVWVEPVVAGIESGTTDELGYYSIDSIPAGTYDVIASLEGFYNDTAKAVEIIEGNLTLQDFALTPITGTLEGVVKDLEADTLLPEALVKIEKDDIEIASVLTDENGFYSIPDIRIGFYDVIASIEGFVNDTVENVEIIDGTVTLDFALSLVTGTLEGTVKDAAADALLEGATVWIEQEDVEIASAETNEEGYYTIPDIALGFYDVIASMDGFLNDTVENVEITDEVLTIDFELDVDE